MPLFVYRCETCKTRFEELVRSDRRDEVVCPGCGKPVQRVYEGTSVSGGKAGGCSGKCSGCSGCDHH